MSTNQNKVFKDTIAEQNKSNRQLGFIDRVFGRGRIKRKVFHLGGLGGIPLTGKTGFAAFSHHVPKDGHLFVMMAPHVGISGNIKIGLYDREGQIGAGSACGAAIGAYNFCCAAARKKGDGNKLMPNIVDSEDDYQMCYTIMCLKKKYQHCTEIKRQDALSKETYKIGKTILDKIVSTDGWGGDLS